MGDSRRLSRAAARAIERAEHVCLSAISVLELVDLAERGRFRLSLPVRQWINSAVVRPSLEVVPLTAAIAVDAGQLRFTSDPFDRVIYATARVEDAPLVTCDERMHAFDPERAIW